MQSKYKIFILMSITILGCIGCATSTTFGDFGMGYTRFEIDPIRSETVIDGDKIQTKLSHVDAFLMKGRTGITFIEALPQLRTGIEIRAGIGGAYDSDIVNNKKAYSEILMLLLGGGPFLSWKQNLGEHMYIETGAFIGGYTVGIHEHGEKVGRTYLEDENHGGVGWSGGLFAKIGLFDVGEFPNGFAFEFSYESGQWDFGGDIGTLDADNYSFLLSAEVAF